MKPLKATAMRQGMCVAKLRNARLEVDLAVTNNFGDSSAAWALATPKQHAETVAKEYIFTPGTKVWD